MKKIVKIGDHYPRTAPANTVDVSITSSIKVMDEAAFLLVGLDPSDPEGDRANHGPIVERVWINRFGRRQRTPSRMWLYECPLPTAQWIISELRYWGDPCGGWHDDILFRCEPFNRIADLIEIAITESKGATA